MITGLKYDEFARLVAPRTRTIGQKDRLKAIWKKAADSIGCDAGESLEFEAKVMVESLEHIRETICATDAKIEDICCEFPEYRYLLTIPGFGPDVSSKVFGAIGDPFRFRTGKTGTQDGRLRFEC